MKKGLLGIITALSVCVSMVTPSLAAGTEKSNSSAATVYNEGQAYVELQSISDTELAHAGYTEEEIAEIRSFSMEDALLERASLPDETLYAYGYTEEQIEVLREYNGAPLTLDSPVLMATSDCVGYFDVGHTSNDSISFSYTWRWNIVPLFKMTDTLVIAWEGVKSSNNEYMDLTPSTNELYLHYYELTTGQRADEKDTSVDGVHVTDENYTSFEMDMAIEDNYYWAKEGVAYLTLYVDNDYPGSDTSINYVDLGTGYGHQQLAMNYSFSVSSSLSVSFSPSVVVSKIAGASTSGRIYADGRLV